MKSTPTLSATLARLVRKFEATARLHAWRGRYAPEEIEKIDRDYNHARTELLEHLAQLEQCHRKSRTSKGAK